MALNTRSASRDERFKSMKNIFAAAAGAALVGAAGYALATAGVVSGAFAVAALVGGGLYAAGLARRLSAGRDLPLPMEKIIFIPAVAGAALVAGAAAVKAVIDHDPAVLAGIAGWSAGGIGGVILGLASIPAAHATLGLGKDVMIAATGRAPLA
ncbi:MAG: hypothetical protein LRY57_03310, partial [Alphaproteobacteria bacterium]|nr:hypothetical protein [Alphaproteobacteria bacterium]